MSGAAERVRQREPLAYRRLWWGEVIDGTAAELRSLGIGIGAAFPGESGGPRRTWRGLDPRGFVTTVERWDPARVDRYSARVGFPGREGRPASWVRRPDVGCVKCRAFVWTDDYTGTAEALVAAGLVSRGQFPGMPGMRKVCVTIHADGTLPAGPRTANNRRAKEPGAKRIERCGKASFLVTVVVPREVREIRSQAARLADMEFERRMLALPQPAPLMPGPWAARADERFQAMLAALTRQSI